MDAQLPLYVKWLLDKHHYAHPVDAVELIQTHISYVVVAGQYVYKFKKPAAFGFLDFTSLAKRKYFCEEELRLNRRLCPAIYLQTIALCDCESGFCWEDGGKPVEYAVKMRRLSEEKMMGRVIARDELKEDDIIRIVDKLMPFYQLAERSGRVQQYGDVRAVTKTIHDNFNETQSFAGTNALPAKRFRQIRKCAERFLANGKIFAERVRGGKVCECHGDLHSANICLEDEVAIFDCIEFNESLRCTDIAADLAFLAMDLDYHNLSEYRDLLINSYLERSGDDGLIQMLPFYMCYRAYVRGKIGLLTSVADQLPENEREKAEQSAKKYFQLAEEYGGQLE